MSSSSIAARVTRRSMRVGDCLIWQGCTMKNGYGTVSWNGRRWLVHRAVWTETNGQIPDGLTIDHLCRNRACVNVAHMEVVTPGENARRGGGLEKAHASYRARTHCPQGHEYTPENTMLNNGARACRECGRQRWRAWRDRARPKKGPRPLAACPSRAAYVRHVKNGEDCASCRAANAAYAAGKRKSVSR